MVPAVVFGREFAEAEIGAGLRVRRVAFRPLQVRRVLHRQQPVIQIVRLHVLLAGRANARVLRGFQQRLVVLHFRDGRVQRRGFVRRPAFARQRRRYFPPPALRPGRCARAAVELCKSCGLWTPTWNAARSFTVCSGIASLAVSLRWLSGVEGVNLVQLRLAQNAGLAALLFLVGGLRLDVAQHRGGGGEIILVQPGDHFGMCRAASRMSLPSPTRMDSGNWNVVLVFFMVVVQLLFVWFWLFFRLRKAEITFFFFFFFFFKY